jgi:hypothetical protein
MQLAPLHHGGVRYLEKAVFQADAGQLKLVFEAGLYQSNPVDP